MFEPLSEMPSIRLWFRKAGLLTLVEAEGPSLTRDPVFQLNSCLWLIKRPPSTTSAEEKGTYASVGFVLRALGRRLGISNELRERFRELTWTPEPPEPDVLLHHLASGLHLVLECK